jgi:hypothetical protein
MTEKRIFEILKKYIQSGCVTITEVSNAAEELYIRLNSERNLKQPIIMRKTILRRYGKDFVVREVSTKARLNRERRRINPEEGD